jgi:hypothetical protein
MLRSPTRLLIASLAFVAAAGSWVGPVATARAAAEDVDTKYDARLECFPPDKNAVMKDSGTATAWLAFAALAMVGLGGLFLNAKRSHLD